MSTLEENLEKQSQLRDRHQGKGGRSTDRSNKVPAAVTDIGCERELNEDRYAVIDSPSGRAWIVCDGMGGATGGELAAQLAIDAIRRSLESREYENSVEAIHSSIKEANRIIVLRRQNPAFSGMGTTVVGSMILNNEVVIAHAGDSRAYLLRGRDIQQLTIDHTYVQELVDKGAITESEAMSHPQAHVLTRCLGADPRLEIDVQRYYVWPTQDQDPDDVLLLCSDGLYSLISDAELSEIVSRQTPQEACVELVELAKSRGGYDNITIAILPLAGQLRDDQPPVPKSVFTKKKVSSKEQTGDAKRKAKVKNLDSDSIQFTKLVFVSLFLFLISFSLTGLVQILSFFKF